MRIDIKARREQQRAEIRCSLVAAAHAIVQSEGYDGLTIRKLAERVGLATMSVYSYFADKQDILTALAEDAFVELARRCETRRTADPVESLAGGLDEYVAFGLENPNEYRTIFMTEQLHMHEGKSFEDLESRNPAFVSMMNGVHECIAVGALAGDARAIATMLWTVAHGAVSLIITFPIFPFGDRRAYARRIIDMALSALRGVNVKPLQ